MGKRDPDDLITALSKNLKAKNTQVLRLTFKRGGLWQPQFCKAHKREDKLKTREVMRKSCEGDDQWPLIIRYKQNDRKEGEGDNAKVVVVRLNCQVKPQKASQNIEGILRTFRVSFFNKKKYNQQAQAKGPTKASQQSKTSAKKKIKTIKNQERRKKRIEIKRKINKQKRLPKK